jgi:hypothetical protein
MKERSIYQLYKNADGNFFAKDVITENLENLENLTVKQLYSMAAKEYVVEDINH